MESVIPKDIDYPEEINNLEKDSSVGLRTEYDNAIGSIWEAKYNNTKAAPELRKRRLKRIYLIRERNL